MLRLSRRFCVIFAAGSLINIALFLLARYTPFPLWLDFSGSIYISYALGPISGGASVLLHLILCSFLLSPAAFWLLPAMLSLCLLTAFFSRRRFMDNFLISLSAVFITIICAVLVTFLISFVFKSPIPGYTAFSTYMSSLITAYGNVTAHLYFACATKFPELALSWAAAGLCILITPRQKSKIGFKRK